MREFKFRAWDKHDEKMIQPHDGDFIKWHAMSNWKDCLEVMQYTGLDDLDGVEVYESDVVKCITFDGVSFNGEIYFDKKRYAYSVRNVETLDRYPIYAVISCVVIGNKFEHPHLLEEGE